MSFRLSAFGRGLFVFAPCGAEDECRGSDGDDCAVVNPQTLAGGQQSQGYKRPCSVCAGIAQGVNEITLAVLPDVDDAVGRIYAGVPSLYREGGLASVDVASYDIVAQLQLQLLAIVEDILHNEQSAAVLFGNGFLGGGVAFLFLAGGQKL